MRVCLASAHHFACAPSIVPCVQPDSYLTLHYRLTDPGGVDAVNTFGHTPATLTLGQGQLSPALEALLIGLEEGTQTRFDLPAGAAFGARIPGLLRWVSRSVAEQARERPGPQALVGDVLRLRLPTHADGEAGLLTALVREVDVERDALLLDFNHPLADCATTFEVHVLAVL
jgi:FKBP-type peptidyl-prolyl cis-trans isomerase SlpA